MRLSSLHSELAGPVVVPAVGNHTATLVFLHGTGEQAQFWASFLAEYVQPHVKIVCPQAPLLSVTLYSAILTAWFDIISKDPNAPEDEQGIERSKTAIVKLIEEEISSGIDPSRIVIGGFSQGGAQALYTGLTSNHSLAGIVAMSTWLPLRQKFPGAAVNPNISCWQAHGDMDFDAPYSYGKLTSDILKSFMPNHKFITYNNLTHTTNPEEMNDLEEYLSGLLPATTGGKVKIHIAHIAVRSFRVEFYVKKLSSFPSV